MKISALFLVMIIVFWSCKHKEENVKPASETIVTEKKGPSTVPAELVKIGEFAKIDLSDMFTVNQQVLFKQIDEKQTVTTIDMKTALALYRKMTEPGAFSYPIFEFRHTDSAVLVLTGVGFGGPIWAQVLVDRKTMEIKNIEFQHSSESEGYGAAMTQSYFEDKFTNAKIDLEKNTFTLQANLETRMDGGTIIDGISGATMTSEAALEMVNLGLKNYKGYLRP